MGNLWYKHAIKAKAHYQANERIAVHTYMRRIRIVCHTKTI